MKEVFRKLYEKKPIHSEVWIWLWMMSDTKNTITFTYASLCGRFKASSSTMNRIIKQGIEIFNDEGISVELNYLGSYEHQVVFQSKAKANSLNIPFMAI